MKTRTRTIVGLISVLATVSGQQVPAPSQFQFVSGKGNMVVTSSGPQTPGACVQIDGQGNHVAGPCSAGTFNNRGAWLPQTAYKPNDIVLNGGQAYEASTSFTSGATFNPANWNIWGGGSIGFGYRMGIVGAPGYVPMPTACTITGWTLITSAGTASVDVWKVPTGGSLPTVANRITGASMPTVTAGNIATGTNLVAAGWTVNVAVGDVVAFNLYAASVAGSTVTIVLNCQRV
jgi:hypothetical protein